MSNASFLPAILALCLAYLAGSLPFAVIVSRGMGLADPRHYGSGNPGATNVLRSGNKLAAVLTLLGDALKGWLVVWLVIHDGSSWGLAAWVAPAAAVAVFFGHVFSIFLRFKGGKGVATAAGVLFAISPWLGFTTLLIWLATAVLTRYSSLAALCAAISAPFLCLYFTGSWLWCGVAGVLALALVWRHQDNIRRLLNGSEGRLGKKT